MPKTLVTKVPKMLERPCPNLGKFYMCTAFFLYLLRLQTTWHGLGLAVSMYVEWIM